MSVNMIQARQHLEQDTLNTLIIEQLPVLCLDQLVEIPMHVFHADVQLLARGVQKYVQSGNEMIMFRHCFQKDDLPELQTRNYGIEILLHSLDCNLELSEQYVLEASA